MLWDKQQERIVNRESAEIIRMLNSEFNAFGDANLDFYLQQLRAEIDEVNVLVLEQINMGVYKAGFASSQAAYDAAIDVLFDALDTLKARLTNKRYLVGDRLERPLAILFQKDLFLIGNLGNRHR